MVRLNEADIETYVKEGYLLLRGVLPLNILEEARSAVWQVIEPWAAAEGRNSNTNPASPAYSGRPHFIFKSDAAPVMALALCPEVTEVLRTLFSAAAIPDIPKLVHWYRSEGHRPTPHIDTPPGPFVLMPYHIGTLAVPLWTKDDAQSGYTLVFPGSHLQVERWLTEHRGASLEDLREDISRYDGSRHVRIPFKTEGGRALLLNPGDVFIMHSLLAHAAVSPQLQGIKWRGTAFFKFRDPACRAPHAGALFSGHSDAVLRASASPQLRRFKSTVSWKRNEVCSEIERELSLK